MSLRNLIKGSCSQSLRSKGQGPNPERVNQWMKTISSKATSTDAKYQANQLATVIGFFNKKSLVAPQEIDFDRWRNEICTTGLVDKVQANRDSLLKEQYDVEKICNQVVSTSSPDLERISNELGFHAAVWMNNYNDYQMFLFELEEYGDPNDYLMHENYDFFQGLEAELEELTETHNYIPGSKDDVNLRGFYAAQFSWGRKVVSFYRHPADDFKAGKATKNILGR